MSLQVGKTSYVNNAKQDDKDTIIITVKKGMTLNSLAKTYGMSVKDFKNAAGLTSDNIQAGQQIKLNKNLIQNDKNIQTVQNTETKEAPLPKQAEQEPPKENPFTVEQENPVEFNNKFYGSDFTPKEIAQKLKELGHGLYYKSVDNPLFKNFISQINSKNVSEVLDEYKNLNTGESLPKMITEEITSSNKAIKESILHIYNALCERKGFGNPEEFEKQLDKNIGMTGLFISSKEIDDEIDNLEEYVDKPEIQKIVNQRNKIPENTVKIQEPEKIAVQTEPVIAPEPEIKKEKPEKENNKQIDERNNYITYKDSFTYTIKNGDTVEGIAKRYGVTKLGIYNANNLDSISAKKIRPEQKLTIPKQRIVKNIGSLGDIAKLMNVSKDFILQLKHIEDGPRYGDNKFHNKPYDDADGKEGTVLKDGRIVKLDEKGKIIPGSENVRWTIGIGHLWQKGDKTYLTDKEVLNLFARDLMTCEENINESLKDDKAFNELPKEMREGLLAFAINKGGAFALYEKGFDEDIKNKNYEGIINHMASYKHSNDNQGIRKRTLMEISLAARVFGDKHIPKSNQKSIQKIYDRAIELFRQDKKYKDKASRNAAIKNFNKEVKGYFKKDFLKYQTN